VSFFEVVISNGRIVAPPIAGVTAIRRNYQFSYNWKQFWHLRTTFNHVHMFRDLSDLLCLPADSKPRTENNLHYTNGRCLV